VAAFGFSELSMVKVRRLRSPGCTAAGEKALLKPGRSTSTVRMSDALPLLPSLEVSEPEVLV
jgi:hypothetical protein